MPRAGLNAAGLITAGADLADEVGYDRLTMGLLAERVGVRTPSLYKHVVSLDALRRGISLQSKRELGEWLAQAAVGVSGPEAVRAFADAYRRWVLDHPGRYAAGIRAPAADDEEDRRVSDEAVKPLYRILAGFELGSHGVDAARMLRSSLHGFVSLEAAGGFGLPRDATRSFDFLVETLIAGLRSGGAEHSPSPEDDDDQYHGSGP